MDRIYVTFASLNQASAECGVVSSNIGGTNSAFQSAIRQLDWDVRMASDIGGQANRIGQTLDSCAQALGNYERFLNQAHDSYVELDNWGTDEQRNSRRSIPSQLFAGARIATSFLVGTVGIPAKKLKVPTLAIMAATAWASPSRFLFNQASNLSAYALGSAMRNTRVGRAIARSKAGKAVKGASVASTAMKVAVGKAASGAAKGVVAGGKGIVTGVGTVGAKAVSGVAKGVIAEGKGIVTGAGTVGATLAKGAKFGAIAGPKGVVVGVAIAGGVALGAWAWNRFRR